eukprot:gene7611-1360_t
MSSDDGKEYIQAHGVVGVLDSIARSLLVHRPRTPSRLATMCEEACASGALATDTSVWDNLCVLRVFPDGLVRRVAPGSDAIQAVSVAEALDGKRYLGVLFAAHPSKVRPSASVCLGSPLHLFLIVGWLVPPPGLHIAASTHLETAASMLANHGIYEAFQLVHVVCRPLPPDEYYALLPLLTPPRKSAGAEDPTMSSALGRHFGYLPSEGQQRLLIFTAGGALINHDCLDEFLGDPHCSRVPWRPRSLWGILGDRQVASPSQPVTISHLRASHLLGVALTASWSQHAKTFMDHLCHLYKSLNAEGRLAVLQVHQQEHDKEEMETFASGYPWPRLEWDDSRVEQILHSVPKSTGAVMDTVVFLLLAPGSNQLVSVDINTVIQDTDGSAFPWH